MYIAASINLVGQREKLTGQMPKLAGKCPVTDCYYEHCNTAWKSYNPEQAHYEECTRPSCMCVLVMRNIHPVLQGGSGSETTVAPRLLWPLTHSL